MVLLLDRELSKLPMEALPVLRNNCTAVSRARSLHALRKFMDLPPAAELEQIQQAAAIAAGGIGTPEGINAAAAAVASAIANSPPPTFDLAKTTYIVDARCEGSQPEHTAGE